MAQVPALPDTGGEAVGRRERKKRATRHALGEATFDLVQRQGFEATTVEQITEAADVSPRTFHHYFSCKEEALFGDYEALAADFTVALDIAPPGCPVFEAVKGAIFSISESYAAQRLRHQLRESLSEGNPSIERWRLDVLSAWEDNLEGFVAGRLAVDPDTDLRPALFSKTVLGALRAVHAAWLSSGAGDNLDELLDQAFDQLRAGFSDIERPFGAEGGAAGT